MKTVVAVIVAVVVFYGGAWALLITEVRSIARLWREGTEAKRAARADKARADAAKQAHDDLQRIAVEVWRLRELAATDRMDPVAQAEFELVRAALDDWTTEKGPNL